MKRLSLAVLLVLFLSLAVPPLRSRAVPKYRAMGSWVWQWAEGPLTPVLTPWRRMQTDAEMSRIIAHLVVSRNRGFPPPVTDELPAFMKRVDLDSTATDEWGSTYDILFAADSLYLRSPGPDQTFESEDDLIRAIRYPNQQRRRPRPR